MSMLLKNYTISSRLRIKHTTNDAHTGTTVLSEPGIKAEILLSSNETWHRSEEPDYIHLSVVGEIDSPPDLSGSEFKEWLRTRLIEMLSEPGPKVD